MVQTKTLADVLTGARFLLGFSLVWLGLSRGPDAVPTTALILLISWASDLLDGPLARRNLLRRQTWIGDHDLEADLTVALGVWLYMALAGLISPGLAVAYGAAGVVALWHFGTASLAWGLQALPYAAMIRVAWRAVPAYGLLLIAWIGLVLVVTWPRFPERVLPDFLSGMRQLLRRRL